MIEIRKYKNLFADCISFFEILEFSSSCSQETPGAEILKDLKTWMTFIKNLMNE